MTEIQRKFAILNRTIYASGPHQKADGLAISLLTTHHPIEKMVRGNTTKISESTWEPTGYESAWLSVALERDGRVHVEVRDRDHLTGYHRHRYTAVFEVDWWNNPTLTKAVEQYWRSHVGSTLAQREALERKNKLDQLSIELLECSA